MICQTCGSLLPDGAKFCPECGTAVPNIDDPVISEDSDNANISHGKEVFKVLGIPLDVCNQIDMYIAKGNKRAAVKVFMTYTEANKEEAESFVNGHRVGFWPIRGEEHHIEELYSEAARIGAYTSAQSSDRAQDYVQKDEQPVNRFDKIKMTLFWVCLSAAIVLLVAIRVFGNSARSSMLPSETPKVSSSAATNVNIDDTGRTENLLPPSSSPNSSMTPASKEELANLTTVYDDNDIKILIGKPKFDKSMGGYSTDLSVINESDKDINYEIQYVKVNGFQMPVHSFSDIYAGMKCDARLLFSSDDLKLANIDDIYDIEMSVRLSAAEDYKSVIDNPTLYLKIKDAVINTPTPPKDLSWQEVYNERGIVISARMGNSTESSPAVFNVKNNSGATLSITFEDVAINNSMVAVVMTAGQVADGATSMIEMNRALLEMMGDSIPENRNINSITFNFSFMPIASDGSFSTANMFSSSKITITK